MRINFELNTENENPSMLQATSEYLNNLAKINVGHAIEPVQGFTEPKPGNCACEEEKPVEELKKGESIAESIEAVKEQLAAEKEEAKKTTRRRAVKKEEPEPAKEPVTIEQAKAVAMKALNKGRRDVVKDAFGYVGATSFPSLPAENYADFIKYIEDNL